MISFNQKGNFIRTENFLNKSLMLSAKIRSILENYGQQGVSALSSATPVDTGLTAGEWTYEINKTATGFSISWLNNNVQGGIPIVILIQYGHATRNGAYIQSRPFINQAMHPILDMLAENIWKEVSNL